MFKRFAVSILCACMGIWLFAACGGGGDNNNSNTNSNTNTNSNDNTNNNSTGDCSTNPTFKACIQPIFAKSCGKAGECHGEGSKSGGLTLVGSSSADLQRDGEGPNSKGKSLKLIVPSKPDESLIYQKVLDTDKRATGFDSTGSKMPLGSYSIEQADIDQLKKWIENGAKDD